MGKAENIDSRTGNFEDLLAWLKSQELCLDVFRCTFAGGVNFEPVFRKQMRRAALSVPSNMADGFGRFSEKEFMHFLSISNGSAYEVRCQIKIASELGCRSRIQASDLMVRCSEVSRLIIGLRSAMRKRWSRR